MYFILILYFSLAFPAAGDTVRSIRDIGGLASRSAVMVGRAVAAGGDADNEIEALNEEVERIGAVAGLIGEIAAKTNLAWR